MTTTLETNPLKGWKLKNWIILILSFVIVYLIYSFGKWTDKPETASWPWHLLGRPPKWLDAGLWKTFLYSVCVIAFGIPAMRRWSDKNRYGHLSTYQRHRYFTIMFYQVIMLFLLPYGMKYLTDSPDWWRLYSITLPWPLSYNTFFYGPSPVWIGLGLFSTFIAIPVIVYFTGSNFCSWVCGCGCLAETFGDSWRDKSPKGNLSVKIEKAIYLPLLGAIISTVYFLYEPNSDVAKPLKSTYSYLVDFWMASVLGVAVYFSFGNRIWCRYLCPLRKYIELLSGWYSRFKIKVSDRCIACSKCDKYCQMGIPIMEFALKGEDITNKNSSCIGCGVCVSVCPTLTLGFGDDWEKDISIPSLKPAQIKNADRVRKILGITKSHFFVDEGLKKV